MIDPTSIGVGETASLLCVTNTMDCCSSIDTGSMDVGLWSFPSGTDLPTGDFNHRCMSRGPSVVRLNRQSTATTPSGLYLCEVPVTNGNENIYIGLYPPGEGEYS